MPGPSGSVPGSAVPRRRPKTCSRTSRFPPARCLPRAQTHPGGHRRCHPAPQGRCGSSGHEDRAPLTLPTVPQQSSRGHRGAFVRISAAAGGWKYPAGPWDAPPGSPAPEVPPRWHHFVRSDSLEKLSDKPPRLLPGAPVCRLGGCSGGGPAAFHTATRWALSSGRRSP